MWETAERDESAGGGEAGGGGVDPDDPRLSAGWEPAGRVFFYSQRATIPIGLPPQGHGRHESRPTAIYPQHFLEAAHAAL